MGISGSRMIICRALQKLGLPLKKKSPHASERDAPEVQEDAASSPRTSSRLSRRRFVFVDETGVTTAMTPAYGRAPKGERVESSTPASWESVTVIAAMAAGRGPGPAGVRGGRQRPDVPDLRGAGPGAGVASRRRGHLRQPLVAFVARGDRGDRACRGERCRCRRTARTSARSRRCSQSSRGSCGVSGRAKEHLYDAIGEGLREVTPRDIFGWFRHAGMCVMQA